jgi:hypothetical protein
MTRIRPRWTNPRRTAGGRELENRCSIFDAVMRIPQRVDGRSAGGRHYNGGCLEGLDLFHDLPEASRS